MWWTGTICGSELRRIFTANAQSLHIRERLVCAVLGDDARFGSFKVVSDRRDMKARAVVIIATLLSAVNLLSAAVLILPVDNGGEAAPSWFRRWDLEQKAEQAERDRKQEERHRKQEERWLEKRRWQRSFLHQLEQLASRSWASKRIVAVSSQKTCAAAHPWGAYEPDNLSGACFIDEAARSAAHCFEHADGTALRSVRRVMVAT